MRRPAPQASRLRGQVVRLTVGGCLDLGQCRAEFLAGAALFAPDAIFQVSRLD
jgi:hypothetical protein